jgi:hypothetical protein
MSTGLELQLQAHLQRHRDDGILLDTNVLLLWLIAQFKPDLIGGKRLEKYTDGDAQLLSDFVRQFQRVLTTHHILTETSNLAAQALTGRLKAEFFERLYPLFCLQSAPEFHTCQTDAKTVDGVTFIRLGFTDANITAIVHAERLLLTDDLDLHLAACAKGADSINFTHMREAAGLL